MRVRKLIAEQKTLKTDSDWQDRDIQPRFAPIFPRTRPNRGGWKWRSARAEGTSGAYMLFAQIHQARNNWKAALIKVTPTGGSIVARLEYHGSHPGLHAHSDCNRSGLEEGPQGLDGLARFPRSDSAHRRTNAWTENGFWEEAKQFFRIEEKKGSLI
jgi:hypothetical protein